MDLYISYEDYTEDNYALKYNEGLAGEYLKYLNAWQKHSIWKMMCG